MGEPELVSDIVAMVQQVMGYLHDQMDDKKLLDCGPALSNLREIESKAVALYKRNKRLEEQLNTKELEIVALMKAAKSEEMKKMITGDAIYIKLKEEVVKDLKNGEPRVQLRFSNVLFICVQLYNPFGHFMICKNQHPCPHTQP